MLSNLATRIITAVVLVAVILVTLFALPSPAALVLVGGFFVVAAWEWSGFFSAGAITWRLVFVIFVMALAVIPLIYPEYQSVLPKLLWAASFYWFLVWASFLFKVRISGALLTAVAGLFALLPAWYAFTIFAQGSSGYRPFLACILIVAAADIGAYFAGKNFGRRKLAPQISPGKTWEGFVGGMICGVATMVLTSGLYTDEFRLSFALLGFLFAASSVLGDLWVSSFKRTAGLKDSGVLLPGHGGVLDRVDGLIAVLPMFALSFAS
ncbi:MAG: phosphatidate cytidylyltransferase [Gammaproteobacteria bacterium]|nr:phosphatidate cytidylyltransferase [Gammaproteobacteria bacterium]MCP4088837.1 phosphatidate cytidylyltransferase [Gammaproteobacteria bacterium]MCP4274853.1 phosphatidate cytidylyltransferase [Gammaproteobacteria bacterium]MCP4832080.1 phosphatidate cytidylyltransferase [Gammaproteobacteria bacterium]MCP4928319.1 phosphatidate cytidylyltransferase [Gammaproteobacteria bacterium]